MVGKIEFLASNESGIKQKNLTKNLIKLCNYPLSKISEIIMVLATFKGSEPLFEQETPMKLT